MRARARRVELDGDARVDDLPARAEIRGRAGEIIAGAVERVQKTLRAVEGLRAAREAAFREQRGEHAVARGQARVQRLHHRPEVLLQARRRRRGDGQRVGGANGVESEEARGAGGGADRAERRRAVPAALVVARVHQPAQARLDLEADDVGVEHRTAGRGGQLGGRENRRHQRRARVRERDEAHVVVVERVRGGAVGERGVGRGRAAAHSPDGTGRACRQRDGLADGASGGLDRSRQRDADRVDDGHRGGIARRRRHGRAGDERRHLIERGRSEVRGSEGFKGFVGFAGFVRFRSTHRASLLPASQSPP